MLDQLQFKTEEKPVYVEDAPHQNTLASRHAPIIISEKISIISLIIASMIPNVQKGIRNASFA